MWTGFLFLHKLPRIKNPFSYKAFTRLVESETYEPMLSWGIRMTIVVLVPLFWGVFNGKSAEAMWVIVAAESVCWVELKGSFAQRVRMLLGGTVIACVFGFAGSLSGAHLWTSLLLMLPVVFIAVLFKNLGERGSGLSLTVYVMFIIGNAYPVHNFSDGWDRCIYIGIGGLWTLMVGVLASMFMSEQTPYKRSVAFIWKSIAALAETIDQGRDGKTARASLREIFLKEKEVNAAIDSSLQLYEKRAYHNDHESEEAHQMARLRKTAYVTAATLMALSEELDGLNAGLLSGEQRQSIHAILKSITVICERMTIYTVTAKPEEEVLLRSRILRLKNMSEMLRSGSIPESEQRNIKYVIHFTGRIIRLIEEAMGYIKSVADDRRVYRSYSLMKTLLILHHSHWTANIRRLANINNHSFRYALRTALVATFALFISKWFHIDHGYWLPFTVMIVVQPYFNATIKKALDRVLGTVAGVVAGGLILAIPGLPFAKELLLIVCPLLMVYFLRKQYSIATFFISVFLVALFAAEKSLDSEVIVTRALCTIGGAALAVVGEFALLPTWDKHQLPRHLSEAMQAVYRYFLFTFYPNNFPSAHQWTHYRRLAESANSNAFDSFNRYLQEPTSKEKEITLDYQLISHCIRVVRELNNYHLEWGVSNAEPEFFAEQQEKVREATALFAQILDELRDWTASMGIATEGLVLEDARISYLPAGTAQRLYLDKILVELRALASDMQRRHRLQKK